MCKCMSNKIFPSQLTSGLWYIITATETLRQDRNRKKNTSGEKKISIQESNCGIESIYGNKGDDSQININDKQL